MEDKKPIVNSQRELLNIPSKDNSKTTIGDDKLRVLILYPDGKVYSVSLIDLLGGVTIADLDTVLKAGNLSSEEIDLRGGVNAFTTLVKPGGIEIKSNQGIEQQTEFTVNAVDEQINFKSSGQETGATLVFPETDNTTFQFPLLSGRLALQSEIPPVVQLRKDNYNSITVDQIYVTTVGFTEIIGVYVQGQRLTEIQYDIISGNSIQILDTLDVGDNIDIVYLTALDLSIFPAYTKAEVDVENANNVKTIFNVLKSENNIVTGTLSETVIKSIPVNTLELKDGNLDFLLTASKTPAGNSCTIRLYVTNVINGINPSNLIMFNSMQGNALNTKIKRNFRKEGNFIYFTSPVSSSTDYREDTINQEGSILLNGGTQYWTITIQQSNAGNTTTLLEASLKN